MNVLRLLLLLISPMVAILSLAGCNSPVITPLAEGSDATATLAPPTSLPPRSTPAPLPLVSARPSPIFTPVSLSSPCESHFAEVELSASVTMLRVGDVMTMTATLRNQSCSRLGLPRYSLQPIPSLFDPALPEEITHPWVVEPGQTDTVEFVWRAIKEGQATVTASVWFEVLDDPGPPSKVDYITEHLVIIVIPPAELSTLPATVPPTQATMVAPQPDSISHLQGSVDAVFNQGELLYLNVGPTLAILKLTNRLWPELVGTVALPVNSVSDITVANGYAYVAADEAGLRIVDLSSLANPVEVGVYHPPLRGFARWEGPAPYGRDTPQYLYAQGARSVAVEAAPDGRVYAYIAAQGAGLRIVDVTNPVTSTEVGFYQTPGDAVDVALANGLAYVAAFGEGLRIIDVSQPAAPSEIGSLVRPDEGWFLGVTTVNHSVYLAEGHCSNDFGCSGFLKGLDVSTPAAPTVIWHKAGVGPITNIINAGNYAYAVGGNLVPIDMTNPAQPVFNFTGISYWDFSSTIQANFIKQAAVATGYLYLAAGEAGLRILDVSDPAIPVEVRTMFSPLQ